MKKTAITTEPTDTNIALILQMLADTPDWLEQLCRGLTDAQLHQPLDPGERSFTEDLAHLLNSEARSSEAIFLALLADEPTFVSVHPERQWGKLLRFDLLPFAELLAYFKLRRTVLLRVLSALPETKWSRLIREQGKQRKESVYWRARAIAMHEHDHLTDLQRKLNASGMLGEEIEMSE